MLAPVSIAAFALTFALLTTVKVVVDQPVMLLADRFIPSAGWIEVIALSLYAAFVAGKLIEAKQVRVWRPRIWRFFSIVFFTQFILGLVWMDRFLMTGKLHLPIPALIVNGPIYRGGGLFMLILFLVTIVLVGPAWCSHLCYVGAWDDLAARMRKRPVELPRWRVPVRIVIVVLTMLAAFLMGRLGVPPVVAGGVAIGFMTIGVALMAFGSRRTGSMTHCVVWCPISLFSNLAGRLNPFRLVVDPGCNDCGLCGRVCRYDALTRADIALRRPGSTCTLCGDCVASCKQRQIDYRFFKMRGGRARAVFVVMVVSLHALFLGVARL